MSKERVFAIPKAQLTDEELDEYVSGAKLRATIARNLEKALGADFVREKQGVFAYEDFADRFTFDGSLKTDRDPRQTPIYGRFFERPGRVFRKGDEYVFRGADYLAALDPALETPQRAERFTDAALDAIDCLTLEGPTISKDRYLEQSATLDYLKNSAVTLFNALVHEEKMGVFHLNDARYQAARASAMEFARHTVRAYYAHLIGREDDYAKALGEVVERFERMPEVTKYILQKNGEGVLISRHFVRPEATNPLIIAAAVFVAARDIAPPDTLIGLPAGGTELALAQQYAYETLRGSRPDVILIPFSLHSAENAFNGRSASTNGFAEFVQKKARQLRGKNILIVEDNASTGLTIQGISDMLDAAFAPRAVDASVAEVDLTRSRIEKDKPHRTHVASEALHAHSVGILPISRSIRPKGDLRKLAEKRRIAAGYRRMADDAPLSDQALYRALARICERPTEEVLKKLNEKNAILSFRGTFLSNFYPAEVSYAGRRYPTVEHAYQAQKFVAASLEGAPTGCLDAIDDILHEKGATRTPGSLASLFEDPAITPGTAKTVAEILRDYGYVRPDWREDKNRIMADLLVQKFSRPELARQLVDTGDKYLVEGNTWNDTFWGVCDGQGRNLLGMLLMEIRARLRPDGSLQ